MLHKELQSLAPQEFMNGKLKLNCYEQLGLQDAFAEARTFIKVTSTHDGDRILTDAKGIVLG